MVDCSGDGHLQKKMKKTVLVITRLKLKAEHLWL